MRRTHLLATNRLPRNKSNNPEVLNNAHNKALAALGLILLSTTTTYADSFGSGRNTFDIEFVNVDNPGNVPDETGYPSPVGQVDYSYRIGKYEISEAQAFNAWLSGGPNVSIFNLLGSSDKPVRGITWTPAALFANWLNTSTGNPPAYKFVEGKFELWGSGDDGYNPSNPSRNRNAKYFLPSIDEWYKAAYFDPITEVYYDYPTGSNAAPDGIDFEGDTEFDAVFDDGYDSLDPNDITDVGVLSPYGTAGQGGNIVEVIETNSDASSTTFRGGYWVSDPEWLSASFPTIQTPPLDVYFTGFRVASIADSPILDGDFDEDDDVDGRDFLLWQRNPNVGSLLDWQENFGAIAFSTLSASNSVPEPSTSGLVLVCIALTQMRILRKS